MRIKYLYLTILMSLLLSAASLRAQEVLVEINTADIPALCSLPGIGPKKARAIIEYRNKRPFTRASQLVLVKGIGRKTLKKLISKIKVEPIYRNR